MCRELIRLIEEADAEWRSLPIGPWQPAEDLKVLHELQPGESWFPSPHGGVVIVHPERPAARVYIVDGKRVREPLVPVTLN